MSAQSPSFSQIDKVNFFKILNSRVNNYFNANKIKKTGNWKLHLKTFIMFSLFLGPYFVLLSFEPPLWSYLLLSIVIGVGMAGVGMNVMHDGNHGSYSSKKWLNNIMGGSIYILAGNVYNWQVQHNVLHHTFTNIHGHDEDLDAGRVMRFTKQAEWKHFHKFQHLYSVFLYGLLTFNWAITTDFLQTRRYLKKKLAYGEFKKPSTRWTVLFITKVIYFSFWLVLPMAMGIIWYKVLLGFVVMHYTAGVILSMVFQLAHVVEDVHTPVADENGEVENTWAVHQLYTTANFAPNNWFINYYTGGLNNQIEHHLFPNISHVHYGEIAKIVKETTEEFDLPYFEFKTTREALSSHFKHLKELGKKPESALNLTYQHA